MVNGMGIYIPLKGGGSIPFYMFLPDRGEVYRDEGVEEGGISAISTAPYLQKTSQTWLVLFSPALPKLFHQQSDTSLIKIYCGLIKLSHSSFSVIY